MKQIQSSIIRMTPTRFVTSSHVAPLDVLFFLMNLALLRAFHKQCYDLEYYLEVAREDKNFKKSSQHFCCAHNESFDY